MKLIRLEMDNFRQYYGKQIIDFAINDEHNTTIIFGENGKGKTGIYRAIMFVLFGAKTISQDGNEEKIHLTNFKYLDEVTSGEASVTLRFEHENKQYEVCRKVKAYKPSAKIIIENDSAQYFVEIDSDTGDVQSDSVSEKVEVDNKINKIINENIKDFFLFDAEKMDTLAKADKGVRKEVKNAIFSLLQIDKLDEGKNIIREYKKENMGKLAKASKDGTVADLTEDINEVDRKINDKDEYYDVLKEELNEINLNIDQHSATLERNQDITNIKTRIDEKRNEILNDKNQLNLLKNNLSSQIFKDSPFLIMNSLLEGNKERLIDYLGDNQISIPKELIEETLKNDRCIICDSDLEDKNRDYINMLIQTQKNSETYDMARNLLRLTEEKSSEFNSQKNNLKAQITQYNRMINDINNKQLTVKNLEDEISEQARNNINLADVQKMKEQDEIKREKIIKKMGVEEQAQEKLEEMKDNLNEKLQKVIASEGAEKHGKQQIELLASLEQEINEIKKSFSSDIRELLGSHTTNIFKQLIDEKDLEIIDKVIINNSFEIEAHNEKGYIITQDISQGQRQILALSFITSLAKLAVREDSVDQIDYPLFMDSPFNRLSAKNRDNLIERIPNLTSQWVLLVTDTELTISEEMVFKNSGKLGKWYKINQIAPHFSKIEEVSTDDQMATRGLI